MKKLFMILTASLTLGGAALAEDIINRVETRHIEPGVAIELQRDYLLMATVNHISNGMIFLTADEGGQALEVPINHPMFIGEREALQTDLVPGAHVTVAFPRRKDMRVNDIIGNRARLGTYDGLVVIPVDIVNKFDANYYHYIAFEHDQN